MVRVVAFILTCLLTCSSLAARTGSAHKSAQSVPVHLSAENFLEEIVQNEWLVMFYDKECSASKKLMPVFEKISREFFDDVLGGRVDCGSRENDHICDLFEADYGPLGSLRFQFV